MDSKQPKTRLAYHLKEIEKEFDLLLDENAELKKRIALLEGNNNNNVRTKQKSTSDKEKMNSQRFDKRIFQGENRVAPLQKSDLWVSTRELNGHRDGVWEISTCPWSLKKLGSASADRTARVWSLTPSHPHIVYMGHTGSVNSIRFNPTERLVCTASGDKTCHIWKIPPSIKKEIIPQQEKNMISKPKLWNPVLCQDNISEQDKSKDVFESNEISNIKKEEGNKNIENLDNNNTLLQTLDDTEIQITNCQCILSEHVSPVVAATWLSDGSMICSASLDNSLLFWDTETSAIVNSNINVHEDGNNFTNINTGHNNTIISSSTDGIIRLWDKRTQKTGKIISILAHESAANSAVYISEEDPHTIISGGDDRTCRTWDVRNYKQPLHTIRCSSGINRFSISPISLTVALPMDDKRTKLCDITGNRLGNLRSHDKGGHSAPITSTAWSNDESVVYTSSFSKVRSIMAWTKQVKR